MGTAIQVNGRTLVDYSVDRFYIRYLAKERRNHLEIWREIYQDVSRQRTEAERYRRRIDEIYNQEKTVPIEEIALKTAPENTFLGSFRDCVATAWEDADLLYHIPKSRFGDPEYNQTAYRAAQVRGVLGDLEIFFRTLESCVSTAWRKADHYSHLSKNSYQDSDFVRQKSEVRPQ